MIPIPPVPRKDIEGVGRFRDTKTQVHTFADTKGVIHTSPGQRPGFIVVNSYCRLKACFIASPRDPKSFTRWKGETV